MPASEAVAAEDKDAADSPQVSNTAAAAAEPGYAQHTVAQY
jgi:hypothetical protein